MPNLRIKIPQTVRDSFPLIFTSFVNKCGHIGLTLLPVFIIERKISVADGAMILGSIKAAAFVGTYFGGWSSDNLGLRPTILLSFLACALGLGLLPFAQSIGAILILGIIAQIGHAMFPSAARMMLTTMLSRERLKEGVGWFRAANNAGQIVSYGLGSAFASLGTLAFFFLDAVTSLLAAVIGFFMLPRAQHMKEPVPDGESVSVLSLLNPKSLKNPNIRLFLLCSAMIGLYVLIYEMMMIGVASKAKFIFGDEGLKIYSQYMVINTVLCAALAVPAAQFFRDARKTFSLGFILLGLGGAVSLKTTPLRWELYLGSLLMTFGEIIFASMAQYTLLNLVPASRTKGALYSISLIFQKIGVVIAGVITLPLVVQGDSAAAVVGSLTVGALFLTRYFMNQRALHSPNPPQ